MTGQSTNRYDVIVIGGGHAGIEAAYAAARLGSHTALISLKKETIGLMPCNPAIGGIGKGHIVFEVSALGGLMPQLCTKTYIQARMLNTKKGPAVQGLRLQIDKEKYSQLSQHMLDQTPNLTIIEGQAYTITHHESGSIAGVTLHDGRHLTASCVVITTGTFLNGRVYIGEQIQELGRRGEQSVTGLAHYLYNTGLKMGRLKTGTPPRLLKSSLDFSVMEYQETEPLPYLFEFEPHHAVSTHACYITHTNERTHTIIKNNLHRSPLFIGHITSGGPRYCPSIEDKIGRFAHKTSHHVFVEPEGADHEEIYPNGISTSLPVEVQKEYIQSIKGFENAIISKPGYAVEYDFVLPHQLHETLEVKTIPGLFLAGQINGTTGYEEAAGQGIIAGINAHLKAKHLPPFTLDRTESYIGIMISDLTALSIDEPYRMFTSRAERRLILRQDNTFLRLSDKAYAVGLISQQRYEVIMAEKKAIIHMLDQLRERYTPAALTKQFGTDIEALIQYNDSLGRPLSDRALVTVFAEIKYEPYIKREETQVQRTKQLQQLVIPSDFDYKNLPGLSKELQEKLTRYRPATIAIASLIPGITPAALSLLIFKIKRL